MRKRKDTLFGAVLFWTILTTVFAWLPLVRIIGHPAGYEWAILRLSGKGTEGPFWVFILLTAYALAMLYSAYRGPRAVFYPMLILWHLAVTGVVIVGTVIGGSGAVWQGQGLHFSIPLWLLVAPFVLFAGLAIAWTVIDYRSGDAPTPNAWTRANSRVLAASLLLLAVALILFRLGSNYNWVTAAAIVSTVIHWILLVESFQPRRAANREP